MPMSLRNGEILPAGGDDWLLQPSCKSSDSLTRTILWAHSFISKWRKSIKHVSVEFRSSLWRPELTITPRITENTWDCSHLPIHTTQSILKHLSSLKVAFTNNRTTFLQQKKMWAICIAMWLVWYSEWLLTCYIYIWYAIIKSGFIRDIVYQFMHSLGIKNTCLALLVLLYCYTPRNVLLKSVYNSDACLRQQAIKKKDCHLYKAMVENANSATHCIWLNISM